MCIFFDLLIVDLIILFLYVCHAINFKYAIKVMRSSPSAKLMGVQADRSGERTRMYEEGYGEVSFS